MEYYKIFLILVSFLATSYGDADICFDPSYKISTHLTGPNESFMEITVTAQTKGWVGLGIGTHGNMTGADLVFAGFNPDGLTYVWDYHSTTNGLPIRDDNDKQNWILIVPDSNETETETKVKLGRYLISADTSGQDLEIKNDVQYILWSYGLDDDLTKQHAKRGYLQVNLVNGKTASGDNTCGGANTAVASSILLSILMVLVKLLK